MGLNGKKIAILVAEGVEDLEYSVVAMRAVVLTAGMDLKPIRGKNGLPITPDTLIESVNADEIFGLVLPGGWAPDKLRRYAAVKDLIAKVHAQGKIIGIICHGGLLAISAKILTGGHATGSLGIKDDLENAGMKWLDKAAFREGNLVWGRVVADIPAFNKELVAALLEKA